MQILYWINAILGSLFLICYVYQLFYIGVTFVKKKRPHKAEPVPHRFAVLISARNEEKVISELIESINNQDYPRELVTVFTVADNCTDNTAQLARNAGAVVYERNDTSKIGKGYALKFLLEKINTDFPKDTFDAFLVLDADNILTTSYLTEMNKTYYDGYKAITSYRNSKNFGDNWISAGYALWFLREAKYVNNSRMILGTSCAISGTGFMIDRSLLQDENGNLTWSYFLLTEDIEFTASNIVEGVKIGYCGEAEFYDEQPTTFKQSYNQRLRWAKGYYQVYANYGFNLLKGIFGRGGKKESKKLGFGSCFSCYDMSMTIMPAMIISGLIFIIDIVSAIVKLCMGQFVDFFQLLAMPLISSVSLMLLVGAITTITEWKHIHSTSIKKILLTLTFPLFMLTYIPIAFIALFKKVEWTPIIHEKSVTLDEIKNCGKKEHEKKNTNK